MSVKKYSLQLGAFIAFSLLSTLFFGNILHALEGTQVVRPIADSFNNNANGWNGAGTPRWNRVNEANLDTATYIQEAGWSPSNYQLRMAKAEYLGQRVTKAIINIWCSMDTAAFDTDDLLYPYARRGQTAFGNGFNFIEGPNVTCSKGLSNYTQRSSGLETEGWNPSDLNVVDVGFVRTVRGFAAQAQRIAKIEIVYTYMLAPKWNQRSYRVFESNSSLTPGAPLGQENSRGTLPALNSAFRIRMGIQANETKWSAGFGSYKLQYAKKISTCAAASYSDVLATSGDIRWNNDTPSDGASIQGNGYTDDPNSDGIPPVYQTYKESNPFTNSAEVALSAKGLWDFSLRSYATQSGSEYCFRIVKEDMVAGHESFSYTHYPEVKVLDGVANVSIVNQTGGGIAVGSVFFPSLPYLSSCQTNNAVLGTASQRVRVTDNRRSGSWSLSIAPSDGSWQSQSNPLRSYAYNNAAGSPAGCLNGQLKIDLGATTITPKAPSCSGGDLSLSSGAAYSSSVGAITVASSSYTSSSERGCYWDLTNIGLEQKIPGNTWPGEYKLPMTLTLMTGV